MFWTGHQPRSGVITDARWDRWCWYAQLERVVPLLYMRGLHNDGLLSVTQQHALRAMQGDAMVWAVRVEHQMLEAIKTLSDAGVQAVVLKGMATAHLDYPDSSWRQVGDADLLVDAADFVPALSALEAEGWRQEYELPRGHLRFTHAVTLIRNSVELDLHQRIAHRAIGLLIPTSELFAARVGYEVAGRELFALSATDRLIHAAIHAQLSSGATKRLSSVADVLVLADGLQGDAVEVLKQARQWSVANIVQKAVHSAYEASALEVPEGWRASGDRSDVATTPWVERVHLKENPTPWKREFAYLCLMHSWFDRGRYVLGHVGGPEGTTGLRGWSTRLAYLWRKVRNA